MMGALFGLTAAGLAQQQGNPEMVALLGGG